MKELFYFFIYALILIFILKILLGYSFGILKLLVALLAKPIYNGFYFGEGRKLLSKFNVPKDGDKKFLMDSLATICLCFLTSSIIHVFQVVSSTPPYAKLNNEELIIQIQQIMPLPMAIFTLILLGIIYFLGRSVVPEEEKIWHDKISMSGGIKDIAKSITSALKAS